MLETAMILPVIDLQGACADKEEVERRSEQAVRMKNRYILERVRSEIEKSYIESAHGCDEFFPFDSAAGVCESKRVKFERLPRRNAR